MIKLLATLAEFFVPVVGDIVENVKSKDGGQGRFFTEKFVKQVIRLVVLIAIIILIFKGQATLADLDTVNTIK